MKTSVTPSKGMNVNEFTKIRAAEKPSFSSALLLTDYSHNPSHTRRASRPDATQGVSFPRAVTRWTSPESSLCRPCPMPAGFGGSAGALLYRRQMMSPQPWASGGLSPSALPSRAERNPPGLETCSLRLGVSSLVRVGSSQGEARLGQ